MTKYLIFMISVLTVILLLALCLQNITIESKASAQLPVPSLNPNSSILTNPSPAVTTSNDNTTITIHTTNSIQGNRSNLIKLLPLIRKAIASNIVNAILMAKGSVESTIPVNVNAKIINQLADGRVDTTQGIEMTNRLIATELINAINLITTNNDLPSHLPQQSIRVAVDNQAICTSIASASKAACFFTINIHK
ncbi:MAG TPA: hypothetical protein VH500_18180 [Nitrososphaeraceae archaeon]